MFLKFGPRYRKSLEEATHLLERLIVYSILPELGENPQDLLVRQKGVVGDILNSSIEDARKLMKKATKKGTEYVVPYNYSCDKNAKWKYRLMTEFELALFIIHKSLYQKELPTPVPAVSGEKVQC